MSYRKKAYAICPHERLLPTDDCNAIHHTGTVCPHKKKCNRQTEKRRPYSNHPRFVRTPNRPYPPLPYAHDKVRCLIVFLPFHKYNKNLLNYSKIRRNKTSPLIKGRCQAFEKSGRRSKGRRRRLTYSIKEKHPEIFLRMPFYYAYIALPLFVRLISVTTATVTTATIATAVIAATRSRFFLRTSYRYSKLSAIYFCFVQC